MRIAAIIAILCISQTSFGWPQPALGKYAGKGNPQLLFTFDDGPHRKFTRPILKMLDEHNIQGIFFWVGHRITGTKLAAERKKIALEALAQGHIVANHTITHANLCGVSQRKAIWEFESNQKKYRKLLKMGMTLFRAPYGADCRRLRSMLRKRGFTHMHWDIDPQEWKHHNLKRTTNYLRKKIRKLDKRAVILVHDTKDVSVKALRDLFAWLPKENARRRKVGLPEVTVLQPSEWLWETSDLPISKALVGFMEQFSEDLLEIKRNIDLQ